MSYILEALKKSQQQRELGEIPNLAAEPNRVSAPAQPNALSPWTLSALTLGVVALLIAAYGTFGERWFEPAVERGDRQSSTPPVEINQNQATTSPAANPPPRVTAGDSPGRLHSSVNIPIKTTSATDKRPVSNTPDEKARRSEQRLTRTEQSGDRSAQPTHSRSSPPRANPVASPQSASDPVETAAIQEKPQALFPPQATLQRQNTADGGPVSRRELVRDETEKLKQRLLQLQSEKPPSPNAPTPRLLPHDTAKGTATPAPPTLLSNPLPQPNRVAAPPIAAPRPPIPTLDELPLEVYKNLPARRVIVHVYTEAPEERFIILNSSRLKQGETTPEGLLLEEILPNGMIFKYQDQRFFQLK